MPGLSSVFRATTLVEKAGTVAQAGVYAVIALWGLFYLTWPLGIDHGILAWVGDVIVRGGMPYRDAWDIRGPLNYYIFAAVQYLLGANAWGLRLFDLLAIMAGALLMARLAKMFGGSVAARVAFVLSCLWYASFDFQESLQSDTWAGLLIAVAVLALVTRRNAALVSATLAGALIGLAALIKPQYGIALVLPLIVALSEEHHSLRSAIQFILAAGIGFLLPLTIMVGWFAHRGALGDLIEVHLLWPMSSYAGNKQGLSLRVHGLLDLLSRGRTIAALPLALAGLAMVWHERCSYGVLFLAWTLVGPFNVMISGVDSTHLHPLSPPLATLTGIGAYGMYEAWRRRSSGDTVVVRTFVRAFSIATASALFALALSEPLFHVYRWGMYLTGHRSGTEFQQLVFNQWGHGPQSVRAIANYVGAHTTPDESTLVWGLVPRINFESRRSSPTRFGYVTPLLYADDSPNRKKYRREFMERFRESPPRYIVSLDERVCAKDPDRRLRPVIAGFFGAVDCVGALPGLRELVLQKYVVDTMMLSYYQLWRRR